MMDKHSIGGRVKTRRKNLGWTQEDLGKRIGVGGTRISHIEHGAWDLTTAMLSRLADGLGCRVCDLLGETPSDEEFDETLSSLLCELRKLGIESRKRLLRALVEGFLNPRFLPIGLTA